MGTLRAAIILVCHVGYHTEEKIFATFLTLLDRPEGLKKIKTGACLCKLMTRNSCARCWELSPGYIEKSCTRSIPSLGSTKQNTCIILFTPFTLVDELELIHT